MVGIKKEPTGKRPPAPPPQRPATPPLRYEYVGFFGTHFGVEGDEFDQKLNKRKEKWGF